MDKSDIKNYYGRDFEDPYYGDDTFFFFCGYKPSTREIVLTFRPTTSVSQMVYNLGWQVKKSVTIKGTTYNFKIINGIADIMD